MRNARATLARFAVALWRLGRRRLKMTGTVIGLTVGVLGLVATVTLTGGRAQAATTNDATVTVVHGIPGLPVDVYVDTSLVLRNFQPETVGQPLSLAPGTYQLAVRKAGASPTSTPILSASATLSAGENVSVVAHLSATGTPELTIFANDTASIPAGDGRLVVRHTAAAPAVAILANGETVASNLTNGQQATLTLPAGTIRAAVALNGTTTPVIGPADVTIGNGVDTIVYAVGSASDHDLALVTQTISGLGAPPALVVSGRGAAFRDRLLPTWALVLVVLGAFGLGGVSLASLRRTRPLGR